MQPASEEFASLHFVRRPSGPFPVPPGSAPRPLLGRLSRTYLATPARPRPPKQTNTAVPRKPFAIVVHSASRKQNPEGPQKVQFLIKGVVPIQIAQSVPLGATKVVFQRGCAGINTQSVPLGAAKAVSQRVCVRFFISFTWSIRLGFVQPHEH